MGVKRGIKEEDEGGPGEKEEEEKEEMCQEEQHGPCVVHALSVGRETRGLKTTSLLLYSYYTTRRPTGVGKGRTGFIHQIEDADITKASEAVL